MCLSSLNPCFHRYTLLFFYLNELLESTVDRRPDVRNVLPEVYGSDGALGNALRGELELL